MATPSSNSDRLRELRHNGTPEEPTQRSTQGPATPGATPASAPPPAPAAVRPSFGGSRTPVIVALSVVGALLMTSLVIALVFRSQDSAPASAGEDASVPAEPAVAPAPPAVPDDVAAFDRPSNVSALIDKVTGSTVVIECVSDESFGSGFAFNLDSIGGPSDRVVVTNHHVIVACLDSGQVDVYQGDDYYPGTIESWDRTTDLAVVSLPGLTAPALEPNFEPQVGQWVMAVGAPVGVENSASFGYISNILSGEPRITSDAVIAGGSSGGPLVDNQGRVVAVNYAVWEEATGISLSAPIAALCLQAVACN